MSETELTDKEYVAHIRATILDNLKTLTPAQLMVFWNEYAQGIGYDKGHVVREGEEEFGTHDIDAVFFGHDTYCYGIRSWLTLKGTKEIVRMTTDHLDLDSLEDESVKLMAMCFNRALQVHTQVEY